MSEHETPAETIRRAIKQMSEAGDARWQAVADMLERSAIDLWAHGPLCDCDDDCDRCDDALWMPHARAALRLARTYLGETP